MSFPGFQPFRLTTSGAAINVVMGGNGPPVLLLQGWPQTHNSNVVGHDRGARVAHRMALDHPQVASRLAVLDIVPTLTVYSNVSIECPTLALWARKAPWHSCMMYSRRGASAAQMYTGERCRADTGCRKSVRQNSATN